VIALAHIGIGEIDVLVRDAARAAALHETADRASVRLRVAGLEPSSPALGADLVLSTLPPGAADAYADRAWSAAQTVLDVVYDPWPTRLASAAAAGGAEVVSGAVMLVHQAAEQVRLMTGHRAPLDIMRAALRNAPPARGL
jgi:shikimate dehydrogenase